MLQFDHVEHLIEELNLFRGMGPPLLLSLRVLLDCSRNGSSMKPEACNGVFTQRLSMTLLKQEKVLDIFCEGA